jgi:hypothetical protein
LHKLVRVVFLLNLNHPWKKSSCHISIHCLEILVYSILNQHAICWSYYPIPTNFHCSFVLYNLLWDIIVLFILMVVYMFIVYYRIVLNKWSLHVHKDSSWILGALWVHKHLFEKWFCLVRSNVFKLDDLLVILTDRLGRLIMIFPNQLRRLITISQTTWKRWLEARANIFFWKLARELPVILKRRWEPARAKIYKYITLWKETLRCCLVQLFSDQLFWESGCGENLAVGRIWVSLRLRVEKDKFVHRAQDLESHGFLLLQRLNRLYIYVDFRLFLPKRIL